MIVVVDPEGHEIVVSVADASGATGVDVAAAELHVGYGELVESVASVDVSDDRLHCTVSVPGNRRLRSLTLDGLKRLGVRIEDDAALERRDLRLAIALPDPDGGWQAPLLTVPPVPARGMVPSSLRGASFDNRVLSLPDLPSERVRLSLVRHDFPEDFEALPFDVGTVAAQVVTGPLDLDLRDPGGRSLWASPGELPQSGDDQTVDVRVPLELALAPQAGAGAPLRAALTLRASCPCRAALSFPRPAITVVREQPGVQTLTLAGAGAALALDGPPLSSETPTAARADLRLRYDGMRVLAAPRDALPAHGAGLAGTVVGAGTVVRALPPEVFEQLAPARLGLVGRAPQACELSVWLAQPGTLAPLSAPGILALAPAEEFALHWIELPELQAPLPAAVVAARATSGRFLWAGETEPRIQIAVRDPDPGGRAVRIAGRLLARCRQADARTPAAALPRAAFRNEPPQLRSDLFVTIELGDLRLEYAR